MKEFILNEIKKRENEYKTNPVRAEQDYNRENEDKESYHGRELLELLQNADDEINDPDKSSVKIKLENNILTISNDGNPFSEKGILSLMYSNVSPKRENNKVIGNKGTGFRSVLSWSKEIRINSGGLHVRFTPEYSQKCLEKIIKNKGIKAATLAFPEWKETKKKIEYTTEISLYVKDDDAENDIYDQMMNIDGEILLFLNNITELVIETEDTINTIRKNFLEDGNISIEYYDNGEIDSRKSRIWHLEKSYDNTFGDKQYSVVIAYDVSGRLPKNQVIYSYFPTQIEFPFSFLLHADFDLNSNRNHFIRNKANKAVLKTAAELIIKSAINLFDKVSYDRVKFVLPKYGINGINKELENLDFKEELYGLIKSKELFPTTNNKYVALSEKQYVYYKNDLSKLLIGKGFPDILLYTDDYYIISLIDEIYKNKRIHWRYEYLGKCLYDWISHLGFNKRNINKISQIILALIDEYGDSEEIRECPLSLFYNQAGDIVSNENSLFVKEEMLNVSKLPRFAKIEFLNDEMVKSLEEYIDGDFFETLEKINIKKYSLSEIVDTLNEKILKVEKKDKKRALKYSLQTIEWLWDNRQIIKDHIDVLIPSRSNRLINSSTAYLGKEYGNEIGERIVSIIDSDSFVMDLSQILMSERSELIDFLIKLGIDKYPKREIKTVSDDSEYIKKVLLDLEYPYKIEGDVFETVDSFLEVLRSYSVDVVDINGLELILENANTTDIICWIKEDDILNEEISTKKELLPSKVFVRWGYQRDERVIREIKKPFSYIYWTFSKSRWIKVKGKSYGIDDCLLSLPDNVELGALLVRPEIEKYIENIEGKKTKRRNEFISVLEMVGVKRDFADLPVSKIYDVLLSISAYTVPREYVRTIYENLIDDSENIIGQISDCIEYSRFINEGKVLCVSGEFVSVKEALYVSGKDICGKLLESFNIMDLPKGRKNFTSVPKLFGVNRVEIKGVRLVDYIENENDKKFQDDFVNYKQLAFSYRINAKRDENREARRFDKISIKLCSSITISYEKKIIELDPFDFLLQGESQYYFCVPNEYNIHDTEIGIGVSNIICSYLDVYGLESEFRELYTARTMTNRRKILLQSMRGETIDRAVKAMKGGMDTKEEFLQILNDLTEDEIVKYNSIIDEIEFDDINSIVNFDAIVELFNKLNIDIEVYNAADPAVRIDITSFYESEINNTLPKYWEAYKCSLYEKYKDGSIEEKKQLQSDILYFDKIHIVPQNSVKYDVIHEIQKELGVESICAAYNITDIYNDNYDTFVKLHKDIDRDKLEELLKKSDIGSLMYYSDFDEIYNQYILEYSEEVEKKAEDDTNRECIEVNPEFINISTKKPVKHKSSNVKIRNKTTTTTGFKKNVDKRNIEEYGLLGERYVYEELLKKSDISYVKWVSENAKKDGVNPEGTAGYGYDIEYINKEGVRCFIEVKASVDRLDKGMTFHLSENEYSFAVNNHTNYYIYYVSDVKSAKPKISVISDLIIDDQLNSENYKVSVVEYRIEAEAETI